MSIRLVVSNDVPCANCNRAPDQKSLTKVLDPYRYRVDFPDLWAGFLADNYKNAVQIAAVYDVSYQTALNWLACLNRPTGDKVALAAMFLPTEFATAMGVDACARLAA